MWVWVDRCGWVRWEDVGCVWGGVILFRLVARPFISFERGERLRCKEGFEQACGHCSAWL